MTNNKHLSEITAIIIDDEAEACHNLQNILAEYITEPVHLLAIASNTGQAEQYIRTLHPQVIFLDIEMANDNAFMFLERMAPFEFEVIFVTAYDHYAVKAFKLNAVDYILKPIDIEELSSAIARLKERLRYKSIVQNNSGTYRKLEEELYNKTSRQKITLRDNNEVYVVDFKNILFIVAKSNYSAIYFLQNGKEKCITMSYSLSEYEELLPSDIFYRVHRSYHVNCMHIKKITKGPNYMILLSDHKIPIGRRRHADFMFFLKNNGAVHE